ncbi:two-component system LytT family response regulator [Rhizomicrobium palustre]|uniref:Two-component system LytT family response regulator n=1 Tax=Rhizomicrobium palustre TaxID=189966 RepID=A0A846N1J3_9PROT|nr:LytTR family DNA-binding domain-containing protein [Rhizomicrobium palustre]NIK88990.1 two-component system LytT family response regulator [Rhizomicrobium palustre]
MLGAIIADGEESARHHILDFLRYHADIAVLRECSDGLATVEATNELNPALLFLAIDMPKLDGFGILSAVESLPTVILMATQPQYAVAAFDAKVLDYLLKPVRKPRFDEALDRARTRIHELGELAKLSTVAAEPNPLVIKVDGRTLFLPRDSVECIKAERDYVLVCADKAEHLVRETLTSISSRLDHRFLRIHRSAIVNLEHVRQVHPLFAGDARLTLASGRQLTLSRTHRQAFEEFVYGFRGQHPPTVPAF